ncbi:MAG: hypothetical protein WC302_02730 [Candidatus Paceibacterota bacterium]|jgi:hypothetical protein
MKRSTKLIILGVLLVVSLGVYYWQRNIYSKDILKLEILGPETVDLLEPVEYTIIYKNNGDTKLENPELIFEFPDYSIPDEGNATRITKASEELGGDIYPGEERIIIIKGRFLGKEGDAKTAKASLSYKPKNLNARYESSTTFTSILDKVPLTFEFDLPTKVDSGKEITFRLNYFSNADYPLSDLRVLVDYPAGFEFVGSNPSALEEGEWDIGLLNKAEGGRVQITGKMTGDIGEEKILRAQIGTWYNGEFVLLKEAVKGITIITPTLYITQQINNNPGFVADPGDSLHYEIFFRNVGQDMLADMTLQVTLAGSSLDLNTLKTIDGTFEEGDNSILWDWKKVSDLQLLSPQEQGKVEFWIDVKDDWAINSSEDKNPQIKTNIYLSQVREEFITKVNSKLEISQKGFYEDEVFGNLGPIPPVVGQETTYTIMWQLKNYYNDVSGAVVKATLPENVRLTGQIFPEDQAEKFTFDSNSRELVWSVGDILVGQGVLNTPPSIAFQVALNPRAYQRGQAAVLVNQANVTGQDQWTGTTIQDIDVVMTTLLPSDASIDASEGLVQ